MLYLGQVCRHKSLDDGFIQSAIFLGFVREKNGYYKEARLIMRNREGNAIITEDTHLSDVGFIRTPDETSPTGYKIFHGFFCKEVVDENIILKPPTPIEIEQLLVEGTQLLNKHG